MYKKLFIPGPSHVRAEILQAQPDLEPADIREALRFAAEAVQERALPLIGAQEPATVTNDPLLTPAPNIQ